MNFYLGSKATMQGLKIHSLKLPGIYWLYLILIIACVTTYTPSSTFAIFQDWDPYHYQKIKYISQTPSYQRFLKEALIVMLFIVTLLRKPIRPKNKKNSFSRLHYFYIAAIFIVSISIIRNLGTSVDIKIVMMATRPIFYLLTLILFCHRHLNAAFLLRVLSYSNLVLILEFFYALLQRLQAVTHQGVSVISIGHMRSVGTFAGPNSLGLYLSLMLVINLYILDRLKYSLFYSVLCILGIYFTGSRTAFMIVILIVLFKLKENFLGNFSKVRVQKVMLDFLIFFPVLLYLPWYVKDISDRGGADAALIGTRREIFLNLFKNSDLFSILFGHYLGYGSNSVVTYQKELGVDVGQSYSFIADSTPSYLIAQFGILVFPLIILFFYKLWFSKKRSFKARDPIAHMPKIPVIFYLVCSSLTIILFEFYAAIVVLIPLCFLLSEYPKKNIQENSLMSVKDWDE